MKESVAENPQDSCCSLLMTFYVSTSLIFTLSCVNFDWLMTNNTALHSFVCLFVCLFDRIERVEPGLVADLAGMRVGDYIVFVGNENVVKMEEEEVLQLIQ